MAVYKEERNNTWRVVYRVPDWTGGTKQSQKRGFATKREALAWEREFLNKTQADLSMTFASFIETYTADMKNRIKENTCTQRSILSARRSCRTLESARSLKFCREILSLGRTK